MFFAVARPGTRRSISVPARLSVLLKPGLPDRGVDAALPVHLHRPCIDAARFRRDRGAGMTLDQQ